jgi:hypothetical protein
MEVTPEQLSAAGRNIVDVSTALQRTAGALSGQTSAVAVFGSNDGFAVQAASHTLEATWEAAIDAIVARVGLAGDTLELNAEAYAANETRTTDAFQYGLGG